MILLLDNYDSFVHNLARYLRLLDHATEVVRSDQVDVVAIARRRPAAVVISPGPKRPEDAGCSLDVIRQLGPRLPILGVCLGHQAIGQAFGARVVTCPSMHGQASEVQHQGGSVFADLPSPLKVGRYHSLCLEPQSLPASLHVTAWSDDGHIMGIQHDKFPIHGVQFHPESVLTPQGLHMLRTFCDAAAKGALDQAAS